MAFHPPDSGASIGGTITGGTDNLVLFVNPAGVIAQDAAFSFEATTGLLSTTSLAAGYITTTGSGANKTILSMTSNGSQYGTIQVTNTAGTGAWSLGYQASAVATIGTSVLQWTGDGVVVIGTGAAGTVATDGILQVQAAASGAETLQTWTVADDATAKLQVTNGTGTAGIFIPKIQGISASTNIALLTQASITTDSGTAAAMTFDSRTAAGAAIATRPFFQWRNFGTAVMQTGIESSITNFKVLGSTAGGAAAAMINVDSSGAIARFRLQRSSSSVQSWEFQTGVSTSLLIVNQTATTTHMTMDTNGAVTWNVTGQGSTAEVLHTWGVSDDATSKITFNNATATGSQLTPRITGTSASTRTALILQADITTDTGTATAMIFDARTAAGAAIATRALFEWRNFATNVMDIDSLGRLQFGTAAAFSETGLTGVTGVLYMGETGGVLTLAAYNGSGGNTQFALRTAVGAGVNATRFAVDSVGAMTLTPATTVTATTVGGFNFINTSESGVAELLSSWTVSDNATSKLTITNGSATNALFLPTITGIESSTNAGLAVIAQGTTDTGTLGIMRLFARIGASTVPTTRPLYDFHAGNSTSVMSILGSAGGHALQTKEGRVQALRIATTTPVTVAVTDDVVETKLGTPGAVAVALPASPETGRRYTVKDGTGDAGSNNITVTPNAGNIDGAGTNVISTNYGARTYMYDGSQWLVVSQ